LNLWGKTSQKFLQTCLFPLLGSRRNNYIDAVSSPEFPLQWMQKELHIAAHEACMVGLTLPQMNTFNGTGLW